MASGGAAGEEPQVCGAAARGCGTHERAGHVDDGGRERLGAGLDLGLEGDVVLSLGACTRGAAPGRRAGSVLHQPGLGRGGDGGDDEDHDEKKDSLGPHVLGLLPVEACGRKRFRRRDNVCQRAPRYAPHDTRRRGAPVRRVDARGMRVQAAGPGAVAGGGRQARRRGECDAMGNAAEKRAELCKRRIKIDLQVTALLYVFLTDLKRQVCGASAKFKV